MELETFRDAVPEDWAAIADLHIASWRSAYRGILPETYLDDTIFEERRAFWRSALAGQRGDDLVIVATRGLELNGVMAVRLGADRGYDATIENLHVRPDLRGGGLGRRLIAAAAERLMAAAVSTICLWVFDRNESAIRFYEGLGGKREARGFDDFAGAQTPHTQIIWTDLGELRAACRP